MCTELDMGQVPSVASLADTSTFALCYSLPVDHAILAWCLGDQN